MQCREAQNLMPLHAANDLPAGQAERMADHLRACAGCRDYQAKFEASRAWLLEQASLSIDEAFLAEIRAGVRREMTRSPRWVDWVKRLTFTPIPRFVMAAAILLIVAIVWLMSRQHSVAPVIPPPEVVEHQHRGEVTPSPTEVKMAQNKPNKSRPRARKREILRPEGMVAGNEPAPEMTRIEFQTADPNIRIIWLTPAK